MLTRWLAAAAVAIVWFDGSAAAQPAKVRFDTVREEVVAQHRSVTGELRPAAIARVAAEEDGRVAEIAVDLGDRVEAGEVLARLDDTLLRVDLEIAAADESAAEAVVAERSAEQRRALREVERIRGALRSDGAAPRELEDAEIELDAARARRARADADLARSRAVRARLDARLEDMTIRAPFAGQIVAREVEIGEWLDTGGTVVEVVRLDVVDVFLDIPQDYVGAIQSMVAPVEVRVDAAGLRQEVADVVLIGLGDPVARTFPARIRLTNSDGRLRPGMSASASVPTGAEERALTISKDAVLRGDTGPFAYFDQGGVAAVAPLDIRFATSDRVVLSPGRLRPGMRVVVEGNERMYPSQPLIDLDAAASGTPGGGPPSEQG